MLLTQSECQWIEKQRLLKEKVFIGIDHHSHQLTVAISSGEYLIEKPPIENMVCPHYNP